MLVSFHLASNRPANVLQLLDNLESRAHDPQSFELAIKIDEGDDEMLRVLEAETLKRHCKVKFLLSPRRRGFRDLWIGYNELLPLCDPSAYFCSLLNDEVRIDQDGWDTTLAKYVGMFSDHIFRLRTTALKLRNYYDLWECGFAPDSYAFYSRKWLQINGNWGVASTPDSCQQFVAYYLGRCGIYSFGQINRDVPVFDLTFSSGEASQGLTPAERERRNTLHFRMWFELLSHRAQEELLRRARLLEAHIKYGEAERAVIIETNSPRKAIYVRDAATREAVAVGNYRISRAGLCVGNLKRILHFHYYGGGGDAAWNLWPFSLIEFLAVYFRAFGRVMRPLLHSGAYWIARELCAGFALALKHRQPELFRIKLRELDREHVGWVRSHPFARLLAKLACALYR